MFSTNHAGVRRLRRSFSATVLLSALAILPAMAQPISESTRTIHVSGEGTLHLQPDMATVRFGIVTVEESPEAARRRNAEASAEAMNAVRDLGVDDRKMKLETLRLQPRREYNPDTRRMEDKGFEAVREVVVELEDLDRLPELITRVVQKGANRLNGITYDLKDRTTARNEALRRAVLNAREKAALMAQTLGATLGMALRISEQGVTVPRPIIQVRGETALAKADAEPMPEAYASGEIEVKATVQIVFELN